MISFQVFGVPAPQGSKRHIGNGVMIESSKKVKPWREAVKWAAIDAGETEPLDGPLVLRVEFFLPRPKKPKHRLPMVRPDIDKLTRSTCDALKDAGLIRDDSQIVNLDIWKRYATNERSAGATIWIMEAE